MARRINIKVVLIGSLILAVFILGAVVVVLRYSKDPYEYLQKAESMLAKANAAVDAAVAANDYSEGKKEEIESYYKLINTSYGNAYGCAKNTEQKIEILSMIEKLHQIDNAFHPMDWKKIVGSWRGVINISPKNIEAYMKLLKFYYESGDSLSQAGGGSGSPVWTQVKSTAEEIINIIKDKGLEEDLFVLKAQARATLEIVTSGQTTSDEQAIENVIKELEYLQETNPSDADIYLYLALAHGKLGSLRETRIPNALKKAEETQYAILTKGMELAEDKAKIQIALLNHETASLANVKDETAFTQKLQKIRNEYEALARKYPNNGSVYKAQMDFYLRDNYSLTKAMEVINKAVELEPTNVYFALLAGNLYYNDFSINKKKESLNKAIDLGTLALELPDAQLKPGPREQMARYNYYGLNSFLALCQLERAFAATEIGDEEQKKLAISEAELLIHNIKQFLTENAIVFSKWDGLLAIAKGDTQTAIRKLYKCQAELKSTGNVDTQVSYMLSKLLSDNTEFGARIQFLRDALDNRSGNKGFVSIAITKPESLLEYAEILIQLQQPLDAGEVLDYFEKKQGITTRSKQIRALAHIRSGRVDDAKALISELDPESPETIFLKIDLLTQQIFQFSAALESKGPSSMEHESPDGESYSRVELAQFRKERVELAKKFQKLRPKKLSAPLNICEDLLQSGNKEAATDLINAYLDENPEDVDAILYKRILKEPDPLNIPEERRKELTLAVLNEISDEFARHIKLGSYYNTTGEQDLAEAEFKKALAIKPDNRQAISGLFDIAIFKEDMVQAKNIAAMAKEHNTDLCDGEFFAARLDIVNDSLQDGLKRLDKCLEFRPLFPYAYSLKSQVSLKLNHFDDAVEMARRAYEMNPLDGTLAKYVVIAMRARNDNLGNNVGQLNRTELENALLRAMSLNPTDWKLQGIYYKLIVDRKPDYAIAEMQKMAKRFPSLDTYMLLGQTSLNLAVKEIDKEKKDLYFGISGDAYKSAYALAPENNEVVDAYSEYLRVSNKYNEATEIFGSRSEVMWQFYKRDGQFEKAKEILLELYKTDPKDTSVLKGLSQVSSSLSDQESLKRYSEELITVDKSIDNELFQIHLYLETGLVHEANVKLTDFRKRNENEPRGLMLEAWSLMTSGKLDEALISVNRTLQAEPENAIAWRLRGQIHSFQGSLDEAIAALEKSKSIDDTPMVQYELANTYKQAGDLNKAIGILVQSIQDDRATVKLWAMLETLYQEMGRKTDLGKFYTQAIKKYPDQPYWLLRLGYFELSEDRFPEAEKSLLKAWELSLKKQGNMACLSGYLFSLQKQRKNKEVIEYAKRYTETEFAPMVYLYMADSELYFGNQAKALENYHTAIEKSNNNSDYILKILDSMTKKLGPETVLSWCNKRLETDPDSLPANYALALQYQQNDNLADSLRYTDICLRITKDQEDKWLEIMAMKGALLIKSYLKDSTKETLKKGIDVYEEILKKRPNNSGIMNNLAYLLADNDQDLERACELSKRAHEVAPNDANKMDTYAYTLVKLQRYKEAEQMLQSSIQLFDTQPSVQAGWEVYYHLGMAQAGLGKTDKAKASYMRAIKLGEKSISKSDLKKINDALDSLSGV